MPKALKRRLLAEAVRKHLKGDRKNAYVYGTMRKTGWKPERENEHESAKHERKEGGKDKD